MNINILLWILNAYFVKTIVHIIDCSKNWNAFDSSRCRNTSRTLRCSNVDNIAAVRDSVQTVHTVANSSIDSRTEKLAKAAQKEENKYGKGNENINRKLLWERIVEKDRCKKKGYKRANKWSTECSLFMLIKIWRSNE